MALDEAWLRPAEAATIFAALRRDVAWRQERIRIAGKEYPQPRLTAWYGDGGATYTYSGLTLAPLPWLPELESLRNRLESSAGTRFNSVLGNLYRDGRDSMGFHADDEPELGKNPVIASVSLGATRRFALRHATRPAERLDLDLPGGSLLVMSGTTQHFWRHGVPKRVNEHGERINLTFRRVAIQPDENGSETESCRFLSRL